MQNVPIYFDGSITLAELSKAVDAIGCQMSTGHDGAILIGPASIDHIEITAPDTDCTPIVVGSNIVDLPNFLRPQAE